MARDTSSSTPGRERRSPALTAVDPASEESALAAEAASPGTTARHPSGDSRPSEWLGGELAPSADALGLYVHFPFCSVRCPYCDFAVDDRREIPHDAYADAVVGEIAARAPAFRFRDRPGPPLVSVYFGGGTPGLWHPRALARVIEAAARDFGAAAGEGELEITVEANPGELDAAHLAELRRAGVNRLSLGVQALEDRFLVTLGRHHDAAAGVAALEMARAVGFTNISIDLMFGLPGQTLADWHRGLDAALALAPEHVSAYALTVERATAFGSRQRRGELQLPADDETAAMQIAARHALAAAGLAQYEVSSYARSGYESRHNALYWRDQPYLGVGASAASYRPLAGGVGWRAVNPRATDTYLRAARRAGAAGLAPVRCEHLAFDESTNQAIWLALRTTAGLDRRAFERRFGFDPLSGREEAAERLVARGWLEITPTVLRPTPEGLLFADEIAVRLWQERRP